VPPPVASRQPTSQVRVTPSPSPTVEEDVEPTATTAPTAEPTVEVPTPAPTPVPVPPTPDEASGEGPVINVAPGETTPEPSGGAVEPSAGESASQMPQTYNPNTGGGGSTVPLWLGVLSAVMVLGGWSLRRVSRPSPVRVRREDDAR
jgi:LPXTG-motif cell wall-anchored protein